VPFNASTAVQSSTMVTGRDDAYKACDGVKETNFGTPPHCTHTTPSTDNWWQVEMSPAGPVTAVDLYFRSDCCSTFVSLYCTKAGINVTSHTCILPFTQFIYILRFLVKVSEYTNSNLNCLFLYIMFCICKH